MSWIYQRFPRWYPDHRDMIVFSLVARLNGYQQLNRDNHERRMVQIRAELDRLGVHEFACTPYDAPAWDAMRPAWMLTDEEQRTWRAVVPIVCFMYVRMHHVDRVKRQLGGEQQVPEDPVNLDGLLAEACRVRFLSPADALDDPRLDALPDDVPATASQPRDILSLPRDVPFTTKKRRRFRPDIRRQARGGHGRGADGEPQRPIGAIDSEEEAEYDRQEDAAGTSGHGGEADTQGTHDAMGGPVIGEDIPVDDAFFDGAEHDFQASFGASQQFMEPSMDFITTVLESQFGQVADQYQRARAAAAAFEHLAPVRPPPPSTGEDMSWFPPITTPSHGQGFTSTAPVFHQWGTPPSWEYPVSHSGSGGSQYQFAPPQQPTTVIRPQPRRTQRQRHPPVCGTSSHLQPPHQHQ
ncbi:hypothetical protein PIB30_026764 [Stylosanthes scabra]|uniref:Aminotransferase-like plant mobile domain-containing protein n=1 Tax=Stylosanthes scabra TaxID=79078 RepID=A0ABU6X8M3_9FABA|nr:hypothetical protein [Stylosanthes scabra]